MKEPEHYSFLRYLAAKKTIDDRALHAGVWETLKRHWPSSPGEGGPQVLEVGMGIGTMLERLLERGVFTQGTYLGIDSERENIHHAQVRFAGWADQQAYRVEQAQDRFSLVKDARRLRVMFQQSNILQTIGLPEAHGAWDVLLAHAILDLLNLHEAVPGLLGLLKPGGMFYFSMNFDGETIFEPVVDENFDAQVVHLYHQSMDDRLVAGRPSGDSQTGRHLFKILEQAGGQILEAGASDWVVFPQQGVYPTDEAYFLYHILRFFEISLAGKFGTQEQRFSQWLAHRRRQVQRGELVFIAHQLDFFGRVG